MGVNADRSSAISVEPSPPAPPRDADRIDASDWPKWPMPPRVLGRRDKYQVLIRRSVLNDIRAHALSQSDVEVCGVLVGTLYRDAISPWCFVAANIRGNYASGRNAQVTFTSDTWTDIHRQMEERFPKQRILGWYHSHPGFGIFLSDMDLFIQEHFFSAPWQIAFVDDPKGGDRGVFLWRSGQAVREEFLVDEDLGPPDAASRAMNQPGPAEDASDKLKESSTPRVVPLWPLACLGVVVAALVAFLVWWIA